MTDANPYGDPVLYNLEYATMVEDIDHYVRLARRARSVLELGCGTGRLTVPMAEAGAAVLGVDHSAAMLSALERRLRLCPPPVRYRVQYTRGDFRDFRAPGRYPLVAWPFNALHHCEGPEDVLRVFATARRALLPGGVFALDCYLPDLDLYDRDPQQRFEERTMIDPRTQETLESWEQGWWEADRQIHHVQYFYRYPSGRVVEAHLRLRMFDLPELHDLVARAGWRITWQASDFDGAPASNAALKWIATLVPQA